MWLSNDSPPFATYRTVNLSRMLTGDKKPGVHPLACREIWMRLWVDCLNSETKVAPLLSVATSTFVLACRPVLKVIYIQCVQYGRNLQGGNAMVGK